MPDLIATASAYPVPGLELDLFTDTQFASAYLNGAPFACVRRRHAFDPRTAPAWQAWARDGSLMGSASTARGMVRRVAAAALAAAR